MTAVQPFADSPFARDSLYDPRRLDLMVDLVSPNISYPLVHYVDDADTATLVEVVADLQSQYGDDAYAFLRDFDVIVKLRVHIGIKRDGKSEWTDLELGVS